MHDDRSLSAGRVPDGPGERLTVPPPFVDATEAAAAVLDHLRAEVGFERWAVTRVTGGTYALLPASDPGYPAAPGEQLPWVETLCHVVLEGLAPPVTPDVRAVPALASHPLTARWQVRAYLSTPLSLDGTTLVGTLCALDSRPQSPDVIDRLPVVQLHARLLSTLLAADARVEQVRRRAERAETDALLDPLTGLVNRRGWELLLEREEERCRRYGAVASVLAIDLDGLKEVNDRQGHAAGDKLLQATAEVLRSAFRRADTLARLGGDEFSVLAVETDAEAAVQEGERLQRLLDAAGVPASLGVAARQPAGGLAGAWVEADRRMLQAKHAKPHRGA